MTNYNIFANISTNSINCDIMKLRKGVISMLHHEIGKTYYIGYWNTTYKVLDILPDKVFGEAYKCLWANGRVTTHSTPLDPTKDYEIKEGND